MPNPNQIPNQDFYTQVEEFILRSAEEDITNSQANKNDIALFLLSNAWRELNQSLILIYIRLVMVCSNLMLPSLLH